MSKKHKIEARIASGYIEVKSKFDAEFRRFAIQICRKLQLPFEEFNDMIEKVHGLKNIAYTITYIDPEGDLLPINNDDNLAKALSTARPLLRLVILRKGENEYEINGYGTVHRKHNNIISKFILGESKPRHVAISLPQDFHQVSAIIDVDILPETQRRVKLMRNGTDKPLGFYIRDGFTVRVMPDLLEKVPGIFISRLVAGGLAESTGLLAVDDEVLEVNGIEVAGKTLDQVTDMMVANSANLIVTIKPVNQHGATASRHDRAVLACAARLDSSSGAAGSSLAVASLADEPLRDDDDDEIKEFVSAGNDNLEILLSNEDAAAIELPTCESISLSADATTGSISA